MLNAMVIPTRQEERRSQSTTAGMLDTALKTDGVSRGITSRGLRYWSAAKISPAQAMMRAVAVDRHSRGVAVSVKSLVPTTNNKKEVK
jgi:hypothetical protein